MKFSLVFSILILSSVSFAQNNQGSSTEQQPMRRLNIKARVVPSSKDTVSRFNGKLSDLEKKLESEKDIQKRYALLSSGANELSSIKEKGPRPEDEGKAVEMAVVVDTLDKFLTDKDGGPSKCKEQYADTENKMAGNAGADPHVKKGLQVLRLVCGN